MKLFRLFNYTTNSILYFSDDLSSVKAYLNEYIQVYPDDELIIESAWATSWITVENLSEA